MANTYLTIDMITNEFLRRLVNNLTFARYVNRQFDGEFGRDGAKIGDTLRMRKPPRYRVVSGPDITGQIQDYTDLAEPLTLQYQDTVPVNWTTKDQTLSIDQFGERVIEGQAAALANKIDARGLELYKRTALAVGTPGTIPSELVTYASALAQVKLHGGPVDNMYSMCVDPIAEVTVIDTLKGLFQQSTQIARQYTQGRMGTAAGMEWSMDQNVKAHTIGAHGGTPVISGGSQTGSSLSTSGWTASTQVLNQGDVITIAGVNSVNYMSYEDTGQLRQFVVTADVTSSGTGTATVPISPAIVLAPDNSQTVTAGPADAAPITVFGNASTFTKQHMLYHRDAFVLGMAPLYVPNGVDMASQATDEQLGVSVRIIRDYSVNPDTLTTRADVLYGWDTYYADLACRVMG